MTLHGLPPGALGVIAAVAGAIVVLMYTVRWRLPQRPVATLALWRQVATRRRGAGRLGALEQVVSLLLQLLIASALVAALGQPRFSCQSEGGRAVVLVFDRSASMGALERIEPRIEMARRRALERLERTAADDVIGVVLAGGDPEIALPLSRDPARARERIARATLRSSPGRLAEAVGTACGLIHGFELASLVVVTDGSEPIGACEDARFEALLVGTARPNLGVTALATAVAPRDPLHVEAFVEIVNASTASAQAELRLDLDGSLLRVAELDLGPGARVRRVFDGIPFTETGRLQARLDKIHFNDGGTDALRQDDAAFAVVTRRTLIPVDLVGDSAPLRIVLGANPRYAVTQRKSIGEATGAVTAIAGPIAEVLPPGRYLLVDPSGPGAPIALGKRLANPKITYWHDEHPILRRVVLSDVLVSEATAVTLRPPAVALAGSPGGPLVFAFADGPLRLVGLPFDLERSNLPLRVGFPVLVYNAIDWLVQASETETEPLAVRSATAAEVIPPFGRRQRLEPIAGTIRVDPGPPGFYELVRDGKPFRTFAVSVASAEETTLAPRPVEQRTGAPGGRLRDRDLAPWLVVLALALLLVEWVTFHRRKTT